jgi:hypothetical protein
VHIFATGKHAGKSVPLIAEDHFDSLSEIQQRALKEARKHPLQPCCCTTINNDAVDQFREKQRLYINIYIYINILYF